MATCLHTPKSMTQGSDIVTTSGVSDFIGRLKQHVDSIHFSRVRGLQDFSRRLTPVLQEATEWRRNNSPLFNIFKALGVERKEVAISRILTFLLSPRAAHEQGDVFLSMFLQQLDQRLELAGKNPLPRTGLREALVQPEAWIETPQGESARLDIRIECGREFLLVIENKIDHQEGDGQLEKYRAWMTEQPHSRQVLVFLTPDGRLPSSIKPESCICFSYQKDIREWLASAGQMVRSNSVLDVIDQFQKIISTY